MKRTVSFIIVLVMLCLCLASCSANEAPEGYQLISSDEVAYRFYAPMSWSVNNAGGVDSVYYSPSDPAMVMVTYYTPDAEHSDIESYWAYVEGEYKANYEEYTLVSSGMAALGKRNAVKYVFTAKIAGVDYKVMQLISGYGNYYYTMTYMASPETFDAHLDDVDGMATEFVFR